MNCRPTFTELPSTSMQTIYHTIQQIATSDIPIIIIGETGVGKEGIAKYIHNSNPKQDKPFVAINCGRFSAEFLQSELFGHERGAFTGAERQRSGAFEKANGGVLFLDEITEMCLDAQKMFLRFLDTNTFTRLGGNQVLTTDVQLIAATNRSIGMAVAQQEFREDLYYRLDGVVLRVPPLRDRPEDIAPLVQFFITELAPKHGKNVIGITPAALTHLEQAKWPGNIRQLRNTIHAAISLAQTDQLELEDFPDNLLIAPDLEKPNLPFDIKQDTSYSVFAQDLISQLKALSEETQYEVAREVLEYLSNLQKREIFWTADMSLHQILHQIAQARIEKYPTTTEAAASLGIDRRTLKKYAELNTDDPDDVANGFDFF
ncbi:hypothetical protein C6501_08970 [Candidatus Poribacteria bacterium]|nr:MAG: hypothetical protein C6501_08970 [Candidatus Poribacteria bacterium]